jgi:HK97 family phage major capsid protein
MHDIERLKREKAALVASMRSITDVAEARSDKRLTEVEAGQWSAKRAEVDELTKRIERCETENRYEMESVPTPSNTPKTPETRQGGFRSLPEQLLAVMKASRGQGVDERLTRSATGIGTMSDSDGGFLIQKDFVSGIIDAMYSESTLATKCKKIGIGPNSNGLVTYGPDETSRVNGSRFGGVQVYWASEAGTVSATKPKWRKMSVNLEKILGFVYCTDEMLDDASQIAGVTNAVLGSEIAVNLDNAIFRGDGAGKPMGILNSGALVKVPKEAGQKAGTIVAENIMKMRQRLAVKSRPTAAWYINQDCGYELSTMAFVVGTGGVPVYLPANGLSAVPYDTLFGMPVMPVEYASTVGTVGDVLLADLSQYILIDKGGLKQDVSMHVQFLAGEQVFRVSYRVGGQPIPYSAITPMNGTNTYSPFVTLDTRA